MKFKKAAVTALLMCIVMLITGCGKSIYREYTDASKKMAELDSVKGTLT